ncbi:hypothetical protein [Caulobacter sp. S45]|jgi:hypothetical protein|uniref:hypothetical protein n=1 Tax=Caulobacter sp. S45 TaxID=1641861 RepID=UPI00131D32CF|nr:hypothetical protein [Caulobacter sp. S45]
MPDPIRTHTPAWRRFKQMQRSTCAAASLIYAGAAVHAWRVLPGPEKLKIAVILVFPAIYALAAFVLPLQIKPVRRGLKRYVWMSFGAGFGQTPISVITGLGLLATAAVFIYLQIAGVAHGGRYPSGVFSGYGAGIGVLYAQALLSIALEREPKIQEIIEAAD